MNMDTFIIKGDKIVNNKNKKVASTKDIKKNYVPVVVHKGERIIEKNIKELKRLEKKYKVNLYPKK